MKWFHQEKHWELGNFIMVTPALRLLSDRDKARIPVYFDTKSVEQLYHQCPFIDVLRVKPACPPLATTKSPRRNKGESDYDAWCRILIGNRGPSPLPYVDVSGEAELVRGNGQKHVAVFHGGLGNYWLPKKDIGPVALEYILTALRKWRYTPVLLGDDRDFQHFWKRIAIDDGCVNCIGSLSMVDSVKILSQCDAFISNDTGLYHVAGALNKIGLVLWKTTNHEKNRSPCALIQHFKDERGKVHNYIRAVDQFLQRLSKDQCG